MPSNSGELSSRQSRAKPLEEGVETRRWPPKSLRYGEGIVQTTTYNLYGYGDIE